MQWLLEKQYPPVSSLPSYIDIATTFLEAKHKNLTSLGSGFDKEPWQTARAELDAGAACTFGFDSRMPIYMGILQETLKSEPIECAAFIAQSFWNTTDRKDEQGCAVNPTQLGYRRLVSFVGALSCLIQDNKAPKKDCVTTFRKTMDFCAVYGNDSELLCNIADFLVDTNLYPAMPPLLFGLALRQAILSGHDTNEKLTDKYLKLDPDIEQTLTIIHGEMAPQIKAAKETAREENNRHYIEVARAVLMAEGSPSPRKRTLDGFKP